MSVMERVRGPSDEHAWAQTLATRLIDAAKKAGADGCDATVGIGASVSAKARDGEIEYVTRSSSRGAGVRVVVEGRLGFATAAEAPRTDAAVDDLVRQAIALARISSPSEHNQIPEANGPQGEELEALIARLQLWDASVAAAESGWAAEQSLTMERVLSSTQGIATVREVAAGTQWGIFALATSSGFCGSYGGTSASLSASAVAEDANGKKQVGGHWDAARRFDVLGAPEDIAREAAKKVLERLGARKVKSARVPVIFDPVMAKGFFGAILGAMNGDAVARGASFLRAHLGETVMRRGIVLRDDPLVPGAFGSHPFDGEGLAVKPTTLLNDQGQLLTWLTDTRSANRLGVARTAHASRGATSLPHPAPTNVTVDGGVGDLEAIVRATPRGLLVTQVLGHAPDMITGDYSRGASGFWIEDGVIAYPVEEVTIAGHMLDMMRDLDHVGADLDRRSSLHAPTLRFAELAVSGA